MGKKKNAKSQGRAKQKQKAQRGGGGFAASGPIASHPGAARGWGIADPDLDNDDDDMPDTSKGFRGFAMSNAAKSPGRALSSNVKLRHQMISFVSAGTNVPTPMKELAQPDERDMRVGDGDERDHEEARSEDEEDVNGSAIVTNMISDMRTDADLTAESEGIAQMSLSPSVKPKHTINSTHDLPGLDGAMDTAESVSFVVDTVGDETLASKFPAATTLPARTRAASPTPSNSSEEVIVFSGRSRATVVDDPVSQPPSIRQKSAKSKTNSAAPRQQESSNGITNSIRQIREEHVTDDLLRALGQAEQSTEVTKLPVADADAAFKYKHALIPADQWIPAPTVPYWKIDVPQKQTQTAAKSKSRSAAEETISTLRAEWRQTLRDKRSSKKAQATAAKDAPSNAPSKTTSRRTKQARKKSNRALRNDGISNDGDSDGEAAYDDYMANLRAQMDEEDEPQRPDGIKTMNTFEIGPAMDSLGAPSLVVDGQEIGVDEVLPRHLEQTGDHGPTDDSASVSGDSDDSVLNPNSEELELDALEIEDDDSFDSSDLEDELEYNEKQQWEDEADLRQRRADRMTDEQLARLFAKQEELGLGSEELILDDGAYVSMSDGFGDITAARKGLSQLQELTISSQPKSRRRGRKNNRDPLDFPDASLLADSLEQYGENAGFDIMDLDRPSLRPTKRGRKHNKLPPELEYLSDEDLQTNLASTWNNDRAKKSQKKLEREALRAEGLLGSAGRKNKPDLAAKYRLGMTPADIHTEIRAFLLDDGLQERSFPPMAKHDRKALHEICIALGLNSRSQGAGHKRFPIINKSSRTLPYDDLTFTRIINASSRGYLVNRATGKKGGTKPLRQGVARGGGVNKHATSLRHGDIVGAGAQEISADSVGHRLMEKMGWSKGMALGKDGKGLLVPVEQRMRIGTAGLG